MFTKATKTKSKLRCAMHGPSGSGKSMTSLLLAKYLVNPGGRIAAVDTEKGSLSKYSDTLDFDVHEIVGDYNPKRLHEAIDAAVAGGYEALIVDSMTHFWNGPGGLLEMVDAECNKMRARGGAPNSFVAWKTVDPIYRRLVEVILAAPLHIIMTIRAKQAYENVKDDNGKSKVQKLGMAPQMRDDFQYEWDVEGMLDIDHNLVIGKTRCSALDGKVFRYPGEELALILKSWLEDGADAVPLVTRHKAYLDKVAAVTNMVEYAAIAKEYQENKASFSQPETQEQVRAIRAKHDELNPKVVTPDAAQ